MQNTHIFTRMEARKGDTSIKPTCGFFEGRQDETETYKQQNAKKRYIKTRTIKVYLSFWRRRCLVGDRDEGSRTEVETRYGNKMGVGSKVAVARGLRKIQNQFIAPRLYE